MSNQNKNETGLFETAPLDGAPKMKSSCEYGANKEDEEVLDFIEATEDSPSVICKIRE